jgi:hypothetical protein
MAQPITLKHHQQARELRQGEVTLLSHFRIPEIVKK